MFKLVLASNNPGKLAEFRQLLSPLKIDVVTQASLDIVECDEPYLTFVENALHKARHASRLSGLPALADDSGICVRALGGAPGVLSARYAGNTGDQNFSKDMRNNLKLVAALEGLSDRSAYFYCVQVLVRHEDDPQPIIVDGQWFGKILDMPQGEGGFGYDPYFYVPELKKTAAELDRDLKIKISHRGLAVQALLEKLQKELLV